VLAGILAFGTILTACLIPLAECPTCLGLGTVTWSDFAATVESVHARDLQRFGPDPAPDRPLARCGFCSDGKVAFVRIWRSPDPYAIYVPTEDGVLLLIERPRLRRMKELREIQPAR
jgi:hypothetical protein